MSTETTRALIDDYYAALAKGDRARLLELLAPDAVWIPPASAPIGTTEGAEAIAEALGATIVKQMFDLKKPFKLEIRRIVVDGDVAVVQQRLTATAKATGLDYDNQYCWVYEVRDGRIAHIEEYADTLVAARIMGWL
ncbi:MAG: nuclear transport factor 2 family protein [Acidimicrobiales bacterium]|nr:nuclear transport factor 2 family protein [Acidimicrobiales bacterium]